MFLEIGLQTVLENLEYNFFRGQNMVGGQGCLGIAINVTTARNFT